MTAFMFSGSSMRSFVVPHASANSMRRSVCRMSASSSSYMFWSVKSLASVNLSGVFA